MSLYIYTPNLHLREMLFNTVDEWRHSDSGFDVPMEAVEVIGDIMMHTFDLQIKIAAQDENTVLPILLLPRSSLSGSPFRLANSIGLIDSGYRGFVKAKVDLLLQHSEFPYFVPDQTRYFQLCRNTFMPWNDVHIVQFEDELPLARDNRGTGGFGSTG